MKPQIANIINFIRGIEPREPIDLIQPVKKQLELIKKHRLTGTFLMQYDALINPDFSSLLSLYSENIEIGGWLEIVKPMCDEAGIPWRGRPGYDWDWHANIGFTVGYSMKERIVLADVFMEKFRKVWGYYPASMGSWIIDAHTLRYLSDRYGIIASCNCKDQWGTDGYTLWGGYYNQAYYASKNNALCPAQTCENQIQVPIFRMLGSDPVYQYDLGLDIETGGSECQKVVTLEPVYGGSSGGGGNSEWVDWFFRENYNGLCISFGYAQVGQENSFGWDKMKDGLTYQIEKLSKLSREGIISVQTLAQTSKWFKDMYALTPASATVALSDWKNQGYSSIWYNCINYRVNFFSKGNKFRIRDLYRFDERYKERYIEEICDRPLLVYDNLPVMDGNRWSGHGILAGTYPVDPNGCDVVFERMDVREEGENLLIEWTLEYSGIIKCKCTPTMLEWQFPSEGYGFNVRADSASVTAGLKFDDERLNFCYRGFEYSIHILGACISKSNENETSWFHIKAHKSVMQIKIAEG